HGLFVTFPHPNEVLSIGRHPVIGVAPRPWRRWFGRDGHGDAISVQSVDTLVGEIGEEDRVTVHGVAEPPVFMHECPRGKVRTEDVAHLPIGASANKNASPTLRRAI